jgi:heme/copper-type cytochrome/quinol oxidase subunit 2
MIIIIIIIIVSLVTGLFFLVILLNQQWSPPLRLQASHCSTFRIMCDVPSIIIIIIITNYSVFFLISFYDALSTADITWRLTRKGEWQVLHNQLQHSTREESVNLHNFKAKNSVKILYDMHLQHKVREK